MRSRARIGITAALAAAALSAGSLALAGTASALGSPTAPTITVAAPNVLVTGVGPAQALFVTVKNDAAGAAAISGGELTLTVTGPATLNCQNIVLAGVLGTEPKLAFPSEAPPCSTSVTVNQGVNTTPYEFHLTVKSPAAGAVPTGTLGFTVALGGASVPHATSIVATTPLQAAAAPTKTTVVISDAVAHTPFKFQAITNPGNPAATYTVRNEDVAGNLPATAACVMSTAHNCFALDDNLVFDPSTGYIAGTPGGVDLSAPFFNIEATNAVSTVDYSFQIAVGFSDLASNSFAGDIYDLALQHPPVIDGYPDGSFRPLRTVSRQAFVHFAAQLLNVQHANTVPTGPCAVGTPSFPDVVPSNQFCQEIATLVNLGIIRGYADGNFHPDADVSRQAIAAFLYRVDEVLHGVTATIAGDAPAPKSAPFPDMSLANSFAGDIAWMATNHISTGFADGGFHPLANSSRQATAAFLHALAKNDSLLKPII